MQTGGGANELGNIFKSDVAGYITGFRFYKASGATGAHTAELWSCPTQNNCAGGIAGALLASATFASETASGVQDVALATPYAISANTYYVVSYHEADGTFVYADHFFGKNGWDSGALHCPMGGGAAGPNGIYASGSSAYPNIAAYGDRTYFADVDFQQTLGGTTYHLFDLANIGNTTAVLKGTATADATNPVYLHLNLLPLDNAGALRVVSGLTGGTTDSYGNRWYFAGADITGGWHTAGYDAYTYNETEGGWNRAFPGASNPEVNIYDSMVQPANSMGGGDMFYHFFLPNGNYKVRIMSGVSAVCCGSVQTTAPGGVSGRVMYVANNAIGARDWSPQLNPDHTGYAGMLSVPWDVYIPAKVTNNSLDLSLYGVSYQTDSAYGLSGSIDNPSIGGLVISPDPTPAHWAIDTKQATSVAPSTVVPATGSSGSNTITVSSAANIVPGQSVSGTGIPAGTNVFSVSGTTVTLTQNTTGAVSGNATFGNTATLYLVDWYTGLSNVQWSIVSGPGTLTATTDGNGFPCAVYSAPVANPAQNSTVTIQAKSLSNPAIKASTTLYFSGSRSVSVK